MQNVCERDFAKRLFAVVRAENGAWIELEKEGRVESSKYSLNEIIQRKGSCWHRNFLSRTERCELIITPTKFLRKKKKENLNDKTQRAKSRYWYSGRLIFGQQAEIKTATVLGGHVRG